MTTRPSTAPMTAVPRGTWIAARLRASWPLLLLAGAYMTWAVAHLDAYAFSNDEGMPLMWARLMRDGYSLYRDIWSDHPPALQWLMLALFSVMGETPQAVQVGRGFVVLLSSLGMLAIGGIAWLAAASRWAGLAAMLALALSPLFNWFSRALMPDVPAAALVAVALLIALLARGRTRPAVASGALYGASLVVKLITAPLGPVVLLGLWLGRPRAEIVRLSLAWAAGLSATVIGALLLIDVPAAYETIIGTVVGARAAADWQAGETLDRARVFLVEGHLGLVTLALVGAVAALRDRTPGGLALVAWLGGMSLALAVHHPLYEHHLALVLFALAGLAGIGAGQMARRDEWRVVAGLALVVYALTLPGALRLGFVPATPRDADNWRLVEDIQRLTQPDDWIITDSTLFAFRAGLRIPPPLITGGKRLESGLLSDETLLRGTAHWQPTSLAFIRSGDLSLPYIDWVDHTYPLAFRWSATRRAWAPAPGGPVLDLAPRPLAEGVTLRGYSLATPSVRRGEPLRLSLFWSASRLPTENWGVFAHLEATDGRRVAQHDGPPSSAWRTAAWTLDLRTLSIPADTAPGEYDLVVGMYRLSDGERLGDLLRLPTRVRVE